TTSGTPRAKWGRPCPGCIPGDGKNDPSLRWSTIMHRTLFASLVALTFVGVAVAQDGPLNQAGQALDRAGKNIRYRVETEVARGQIAAEERDVLNRVLRRIEWDKRFVGSTLRLESRAGGTVVLRGSVLNDQVKQRAVEIAENTIGVTAVVDELAVV